MSFEVQKISTKKNLINILTKFVPKIQVHIVFGFVDG